MTSFVICRSKKRGLCTDEWIDKASGTRKGASIKKNTASLRAPQLTKCSTCEIRTPVGGLHPLAVRVWLRGGPRAQVKVIIDYNVVPKFQRENDDLPYLSPCNP